MVVLRGGMRFPAAAFRPSLGIRVIFIEEFVGRGVEGAAAEIRDLTAGGRSYLSFDIDVID